MLPGVLGLYLAMSEFVCAVGKYASGYAVISVQHMHKTGGSVMVLAAALPAVCVPAQVDEAVAAIKQRKAANVDHKGSAAALSVEDYAAEGLRLRTAMARAVEKEE
jgi:hypothetical protein